MDYRPAPGSDFEQLLIGLIEETLSAADRQRLAEILRADIPARQYYVRYVALHANLQTKHVRPPVVFPESARSERERKPAIADQGTGSPTIVNIVGQAPANALSPPAARCPPNPPASPVLGFLGGIIDYVNHSRMLMFWLMALLLTGWFAYHLGSLMTDRAQRGNAQVADKQANPDSSDASHQPGGSFARSALPRSEPVARLTATVDCHWRAVAPAAPPASAPAPGDADASDAPEAGSDLEVGSELSSGRQLDLIRGLAEITFRSGAKIILNGPVHFTVGSPLGGKLDVGKLTARVPHGIRGFTVASPAGKVVDLDTEFGVAVAADHSMIVDVFVGEVAVDSSADGQAAGSSEKVTAGHAARVVPGKPVESIPHRPNRFVIGLGPREDPHKAQEAYLDFVRSLNPVVWFRMEGQADDRVLHDEMGGPDAKLYWDGPGNPFVAGRVGKGLWLRGTVLKDHAILSDYPKAEHGKLSVSAWVYADSRPAFASIAKNWESTGQFVFQLFHTAGDLSAGVTQADGSVAEAREGQSHPFPLHEWQHVAFTADGSILRLYRQGREAGSFKHAGLVHPSPFQGLAIGFCVDKSGTAPGKRAPAYWDGKLDEVAVFNDVLSKQDIETLAAAPPQ